MKHKCAVCGSTDRVNSVPVTVTSKSMSTGEVIEPAEFLLLDLCEKCEKNLNNSLDYIRMNDEEPILVAESSDGTREFIWFVFFWSLVQSHFLLLQHQNCFLSYLWL